MTDEQIIKALECFNSEDCLGEQCPYFTLVGLCGKPMCKDVYDFIYRQKAEIERLHKIIVGFMDEVGTWSNKYEVDISTILKLPLLAKEDFNIRNKIKSEAYKEFAERAIQTITAFFEYQPQLEKKEDVLAHTFRILKELTQNLHGTCTEGVNEPPKNDFKE